MSIEYKKNISNAKQVLTHLQRVSDSFKVALNKRVELGGYASKLAQLAEREEAWSEGKLIGLVAYYINRVPNEIFISNVSVYSDYQGKGIASSLLNNVICVSIEKDIHCIRLIVADDEKLQSFYQKLGFGIGEKLPDNQYEMIYVNLALSGTF